MKLGLNLFEMDAKGRGDSVRSILSGMNNNMSTEEYQKYRSEAKKIFIASLLGLKDLYENMDEEEFKEKLFYSMKDLVEEQKFGSMTGIVMLSGLLMIKNPELSMQELINVHEQLQNTARELLNDTNNDNKINECLERMKEAVQV